MKSPSTPYTEPVIPEPLQGMVYDDSAIKWKLADPKCPTGIQDLTGVYNLLWTNEFDKYVVRYAKR